MACKSRVLTHFAVKREAACERSVVVWWHSLMLQRHGKEGHQLQASQSYRRAGKKTKDQPEGIQKAAAPKEFSLDPQL